MFFFGVSGYQARRENGSQVVHFSCVYLRNEKCVPSQLIAIITAYAPALEWEKNKKKQHSCKSKQKIPAPKSRKAPVPPNATPAMRASKERKENKKKKEIAHPFVRGEGKGKVITVPKHHHRTRQRRFSGRRGVPRIQRSPPHCATSSCALPRGFPGAGATRLPALRSGAEAAWVEGGQPRVPSRQRRNWSPVPLCRARNQVRTALRLGRRRRRTVARCRCRHRLALPPTPQS